jgi:hypothetical protein
MNFSGCSTPWFVILESGLFAWMRTRHRLYVLSTHKDWFLFTSMDIHQVERYIMVGEWERPGKREGEGPKMGMTIKSLSSTGDLGFY